MAILYWSEDNGQLYEPKDLDDATGEADVKGFTRYEVNDALVFTPADLCVQDGDILEALLSTKQARPARSFHVLTCPRCGARNRVPVGAIGRCGKCKEML